MAETGTPTNQRVIGIRRPTWKLHRFELSDRASKQPTAWGKSNLGISAAKSGHSDPVSEQMHEPP